MPNIIPTLTGYELCKGGGINGGWKVVQRNPSCPKMGVAFEIFSVGLDLGVPHRENPKPYTHFLGNYGSCDVTMLTSKSGYLIGSTFFLYRLGPFLQCIFLVFFFAVFFLHPGYYVSIFIYRR